MSWENDKRFELPLTDFEKNTWTKIKKQISKNKPQIGFSTIEDIHYEILNGTKSFDQGCLEMLYISEKISKLKDMTLSSLCNPTSIHLYIHICKSQKYIMKIKLFI